MGKERKMGRDPWTGKPSVCHDEKGKYIGYGPKIPDDEEYYRRPLPLKDKRGIFIWRNGELKWIDDVDDLGKY